MAAAGSTRRHPPRPAQPRSVERLATERAWQAMGMEAGSAVDIFRLPGIYGPGRSAIDQVKAGTARRIDKPGQVFSRIHVEDVAGTVLLALGLCAAPAPSTMSPTTCRPRPARSWPSPASFWAKPVPPAVPWDEVAPTMSAMARSFYAENRRVRNDKIKNELGVALRYPTYKGRPAGDRRRAIRDRRAFWSRRWPMA